MASFSSFKTTWICFTLSLYTLLLFAYRQSQNPLVWTWMNSFHFTFIYHSNYRKKRSLIFKLFGCLVCLRRVVCFVHFVGIECLYLRVFLCPLWMNRRAGPIQIHPERCKCPCLRCLISSSICWLLVTSWEWESFTVHCFIFILGSDGGPHFLYDRIKANLLITSKRGVSTRWDTGLVHKNSRASSTSSREVCLTSASGPLARTFSIIDTCWETSFSSTGGSCGVPGVERGEMTPRLIVAWLCSRMLVHKDHPAYKEGRCQQYQYSREDHV